MIYPYFQGLPLIPTRSAAIELYNYGLRLYDILEVLEHGYDCPKSKRAKGIIERCLDHKRKTTKAVIARSYNYSLDSEVWVVIHVGITIKPKLVIK